MGKQRDVEVQGLEGLPVGARMRPQTLQTVQIAPIPADQPPVLIAGYDSKDGSLRIMNLRTLVEQLAPAERVHVVGKVDSRDGITATIPAASAIGTVVTEELEVPSGEVWFIDVIELISPAESGPAVGDIVQVNVRVSSWPDSASEAGQSHYAVNQGTAALENFYAEFNHVAPLWALDNLSTELRLVGGDKLTLVATLTGAIAGAALVATLNPYGWKGRYLVD